MTYKNKSDSDWYNEINYYAFKYTFNSNKFLYKLIWSSLNSSLSRFSSTSDGNI